jgi:hypothetical protein
LRALLAACGLCLLAWSRDAAADEEEGRFIDRRGAERAFAAEYNAWFGPERPRYLRAAGEALLLTGLGTVYYLGDPLANARDWDDPTLAQKFSGEAVSFDNNLSSTNFIWHPLAGSAVYGFSRLNGLGVYASVAYSTASSALWEYVLEWREKVSLNDLIFTSIGGAAIGEFLFHLGGYVTSTPWNTSFGNQFAAYTIGLPHKLHADVRRSPPTTALPPDALGFASAYWHRFALSYGLCALQNDALASGTVHSIGLGAELVAMPGFLRPGRFETGFEQGNFTESRLRVLLNEDGLAEADARVSAVLLGYYAQDFVASDGAGKLIGVGTELRYYESWRLGRRDGFAFVHLPGPVAGTFARSGALTARARAAGSVDFAAIHPVAFESWRRSFGTSGLKSVLVNQGYVYAFCGSTRNRMAIGLGPFELGGDANFAICRSLQGLDRVQAEVSREVPSTDLVLELDAHMAARGLGPFELRLELEELRRAGSMGQIDAERSDRRAAGVIEYVF